MYIHIFAESLWTGPCLANLHYTDGDVVNSALSEYGQQHTMSHIVDICPLTKF